MLSSILQNVNSQQILEFANIFYVQISIAIVVAFLIFRQVIAKGLIKIVNIFLKKKEKASESIALKTVSNFILVFGCFLATKILPLKPQIDYIINEIFKIVCILFITKLLTLLVNKNSKMFKKFFGNSKNEAVNSFLCRVVRILLWLISLIVIFKELGFDLTGLVAGLGVGSIIISFAAQDTVKSLLSGIKILTEKPFEIGDWIKVGDYQGTVLDITFNSTRIKAADNTVVNIPNSIITEDYVVNWNKLKSRRFDCTINLSMNTSADEIKKLESKIELVLKNNPKINPDTVNVVFDSISAYSSNIRIFLYINESDYIKFLKVKEEIHYEIIKIVDKENIELAYPTQTIYVENQGTTDNEKKSTGLKNKSK